MRLLRLDMGSGHAVDLHPFVTIVTELDDAMKREVTEAVRAIGRGSTAGVKGLVQNQGLLVELDGEGSDGLSAVTAADVIVDAESRGAVDLTWLRAQIDQQQRRAEIEAVMVEEIRADLDASARARVASLTEQLTPLIEGQAAKIERGPSLADEVGALLEEIAGQEPTVLEAAPGIVSLRKRWIAHMERMEGAANHLDNLARPVERAKTRLDKAREALAEAEEAAVPVLLSREEEARLELLSFPSMDETRHGRWRKFLRSSEKEEMQALLDKAGVESWTAYTVHRVAPTAPPELLDAVVRAQEGVEDAEAHLADMEEARESDRLYKELNEEDSTLRAKARVYLGLVLPKDLTAALDHTMIERTNHAWTAAVDRLAELVDRHGVAQPDPDGPEPDELEEGEGDDRQHQREAVVARAQAWLDEVQDSDSKVDVATLIEDLEKAKLLLARHERALARIGRAEESAAAAAIGLAQLQEQLSARSGESADTVEALMAHVQPIATQLALEASGSLPIAIVGDFEEMVTVDVDRLFDHLSELAGDVQVLMISDNPDAVRWATSVGLDRAMVSRPRIPASVSP
jgi:hypothetical protein